jgi:ankyrin repeat protein
LISKGADVNVQEDQGFRATPLHHAVHRDHRDIVEILLAHGANIDIKDRNGRTPLYMANHKSVIEKYSGFGLHGPKN